MSHRVVVSFVLLSLAACGSPAPSSDGHAREAVAALAITRARTGYADARARLEARRRALAVALTRAHDAKDRRDVLAAARQSLLSAFADDVMPAWTGTTWDFYGTSATPGDGAIACGHFLGTVLQHLGFVVDRLALGRLASEHILRTFVPDAGVMRFSDRSAADVVARVREAGPGLYVLGLDHHAAFLWVHDQTTTTAPAALAAVDMCHAGPAGVVCEPALDSSAFASRYRVTGRLFDDAMVTAWIEHTAIAPWTAPRKAASQAAPKH